jgi:hypothetical protein
VESEAHFAVERRDLIEQCIQQLLGESNESGGHYFTIWGPRQTGKTWIMRRAIEEIRARFADDFIVGTISMQGAIMEDNEPPEAIFKYLQDMFRDAFKIRIAKPVDWADVKRLFSSMDGVFNGKRVILLIDEFDSLTPQLIDRWITLFRDIYLNRSEYVLHGLGLIGVRAVLGLDSTRGSPFNIQRSLQIPRLTQPEVVELFRQYQSESEQVVEPDVVEAVFDTTRGQPGLVSWFGELLVEKYNPGREKPINYAVWRRVYHRAMDTEWNNTILNLIKKARGEHQGKLIKLFTDPNVSFSLREDWCNFLYMTGIIDSSVVGDPDSSDGEKSVCRFSCPFVQMTLYAALTSEMFGQKGPLPAVEILDSLDDVFMPDGLYIPALLQRYRDYLKRLKAQGVDPWQGQPRRQDLHYTEAVGHFHLYAWLREALTGTSCSISPEFPTGNGKVDLVLRTREFTAVIEVKSLVTKRNLVASRSQAARYAQKLGLSVATLVVFAPTEDDSVLEKLADDSITEGIRVVTVAFGWR